MQEITKEQLMALLPPNPTILDVGAYNCKDSVEFCELGATVYAFEPQEIKQQHHENLLIFPYAVGAEEKITVLYCSEHAQSSSLRKPKNHINLFPSVYFTHRESVEMVTLDGWYKRFNKLKPIWHIDLIWADVNGCEGDLIRGAEKVLTMSKYLFIETSNRELFEGQIKTQELKELLPDWDVIGIYNHYGNFGNILLKNGKRV